MRFVQCWGAILESNGRAVATYQLSVCEGHVQKLVKCACGRKDNIAPTTLATVQSLFTTCTSISMAFIIFTEDGPRGLRPRLLRDVVSSKATRGNPAGVRTNCNSNRYPAHVQCVEFISTKSKSSCPKETQLFSSTSVLVLTVNSSLLLIPFHSTACRFRRFLNVFFGGR